MRRLLALLPVLGFTALLLAWASAPAVDAMAPAVGQGFADLLRAVGVGCGVALVVLAVFGGLIGLLIAATTRHDRAYSVRVLHPARRGGELAPPTAIIDAPYQEVREYQDAE